MSGKLMLLWVLMIFVCQDHDLVIFLFHDFFQDFESLDVWGLSVHNEEERGSKASSVF